MLSGYSEGCTKEAKGFMNMPSKAECRNMSVNVEGGDIPKKDEDGSIHRIRNIHIIEFRGQS